MKPIIDFMRKLKELFREYRDLLMEAVTDLLFTIDVIYLICVALEFKQMALPTIQQMMFINGCLILLHSHIQGRK